jgi:fused signal recognition particle receptor
MAFSLFGKRTNPDVPEPAGSAPDPQPTGLFERMKQAVTRTRESLASSISSVVALTREVDDLTLDNLEVALLAADIGSTTTSVIIGNLRDRALKQGISDGAELNALLKAELLHILTAVDKPVKHPVASSPPSTATKATPSCSAPPTPSAPPPSSNSRSGQLAPA